MTPTPHAASNLASKDRPTICTCADSFAVHAYSVAAAAGWRDSAERIVAALEKVGWQVVRKPVLSETKSTALAKKPQRSLTHPYPVHGVAYATSGIDTYSPVLEINP